MIVLVYSSGNLMASFQGDLLNGLAHFTVTQK
jgi:hypothetical protein